MREDGVDGRRAWALKRVDGFGEITVLFHSASWAYDDGTTPGRPVDRERVWATALFGCGQAACAMM